MKHRYWLHFDLAESVAHVIAMAPVLPEESSTDPALVTGFSFTDVGQFPQDFIGEVLEISSGDADGLIMIREDRGEMVLWERMTAEQYERIVNMDYVVGATRKGFSGYSVVNGKAVALTDDGAEPDISTFLTA